MALNSSSIGIKANSCLHLKPGKFEKKYPILNCPSFLLPRKLNFAQFYSVSPDTNFNSFEFYKTNTKKCCLVIHDQSCFSNDFNNSNLFSSKTSESSSGTRIVQAFQNKNKSISQKFLIKLKSNAKDSSIVPTSEDKKESSNSHVAKMKAQASEKLELQESERPLSEYMSLPVSQYSVLDAQRIERVDENTFKCYVQEIRFFAIQVIPVLLVRVEQKVNGCQIKLLSCSLDGSPIVEAQNKKFSAFMENNVSWQESEVPTSKNSKLLVSNTTIEVVLEVPFAFRFLPNELIESTGNGILSQILRLMLPRFLTQLSRDYEAWASGDESRKPLGTGEI